MKLKDSEKSLLIGLLGAIILVFSIMYIAKPNIEEKKQVEVQCQELQARLDYLLEKEAHRDEYLAGIETYKEKFNAVMSAFAPDLNQEVSIMFLQGIRDEYDYDIDNVGLGQKEHFYTLGMGGDQLSDGTISTDGELTEEVTQSTDSQYECYSAEFPIAYVGSYNDLKDVVSYVDNFAQRMVIDSVDIVYNAENDEYSGNMNLVCYSIEGPDRPETQMTLDDVEIGVDNLFIGGSGSSSSASGLKKYDDNEGAEIVNNYDFYTMLNAASSDVSAKVVGQNGAGKEASVISNSDNAVSVINYDFYEQDGKNYCKYTLDNSTSYEAEVTSAEDIKLLIQSSARKDDNDKVSARITIRNTTTLPVYVKVNGDDAVSPRVNIISKTGAVKVY
ncbi:MAG: hypothetical protein Q4D51_09010 [Eubacteriales bacterium]|nr:hypothetical protein [Eubacteriales bacterium]